MTPIERRGTPSASRWHGMPASVLIAALALVAALSATPAAAGVAAESPTPRTLWGVDSVDRVTPSVLSDIASTLGTPQFFGRYLGGRYAMTAGEVRFAFSRGIRILVIDAQRGGTPDVGYAAGKLAATNAVASAVELGLPARVGIFRDIETDASIDAGFVRGYVDTLRRSSYAPGFYGNPANGAFAGAYCGAVAADPGYGSTYVFSAEYEPGRAPQAQAPAFVPFPPPCASRVVAWQYGEPSGDAVAAVPYCSRTVSCPNVDTDVALSTLPFWTPQGPLGTPSLWNGGFEYGTGGWTAAGNTTATPVRAAGGDLSEEGSSYVTLRASSFPGALSQEVAEITRRGDRYTLSVWVRAHRASGPKVRGTVVLFGLGRRTEAGSAEFRVGHRWTLVTVTLAPTARHRRLEAAIYVYSKGRPLDADGAVLTSAGRPRTAALERPTAQPAKRPVNVRSS